MKVDCTLNTLISLHYQKRFIAPQTKMKIYKMESCPCAFLSWAPRHGGVLWEWRYSSTHSLTRHWMEVSGQLQAPAALPPAWELLVPIG